MFPEFGTILSLSNVAADKIPMITVSLWKVYFTKSLQEDLDNMYLILSILVAEIDWTGLKIDFFDK